jgi:hypothetical protein
MVLAWPLEPGPFVGIFLSPCRDTFSTSTTSSQVLMIRARSWLMMKRPGKLQRALQATLLKDIDGKYRPGAAWSLEVTDEAGKPIFFITVSSGKI